MYLHDRVVNEELDTSSPFYLHFGKIVKKGACAMRKMTCFFSVAIVVALFSACGPSNNGSQDSGVQPLDGDMPDSFMPPDGDVDAGPDGDVDGGTVCHPTPENLTCEGEAECECVLGLGLQTYCEHADPDRTAYCAPGPGRFECVAGVSNHCDFNLPLEMATYDPAPFLALGCLEKLDHDFWSVPGQTPGISAIYIENGVYFLNLRVGSAGGFFTCGNEGKCWRNWPNGDNTGIDSFGNPIGVHARLSFYPDCNGITAEFFDTGEYTTPSYVEGYGYAGPR